MTEQSTDQDRGRATLDSRALDRIRSISPARPTEILFKVIDLYLESSIKLLDEIHEALESADAAALERAAHNLQGASANVGATALADLCKQVVNGSRGRKEQPAVPLLGAIESEYERVRRALEAETASGSS